MIRIGTSGWSYDHWTDVLYPQGLPASKRLAHYVGAFDTVELNASFYRWPRDAAFTGWRQRLPDGFTMAVKAHRGLTHFRRLKSPEPWVERFERCWKALGTAGGGAACPTASRNGTRRRPPRSLPSSDAAVDSGGDGAAASVVERPGGVLAAGTNGAAYVVMSGAGMACVPRATSDLVYVRMHGPEPASLYTGSYSDEELREWADRSDVAERGQAGRRVLQQRSRRPRCAQRSQAQGVSDPRLTGRNQDRANC